MIKWKIDKKEEIRPHLKKAISLSNDKEKFIEILNTVIRENSELLFNNEKLIIFRDCFGNLIVSAKISFKEKLKNLFKKIFVWKLT